MVRFLINRPIAVLMITLAFVIVGFLSFKAMPVSLLPNLDVPEIIVKVSYPNTDTHSMENEIVGPLRQQLLVVDGLKDIESNTGDGFSEIKLTFGHSTKMSYAFIEVNEKVDAASNQFPKDMNRPQVIMIKPSDIPAFYISVVPQKGFYNEGGNFQELCNYVETRVKGQLEQIPAVSMVDVSGLVYPKVIIRPNEKKIKALGLTDDNIIKAIENSDLHFGNLSLRNGYFVYNLRFKPSLGTLRDFDNLDILKGGKLYRLKNLASISLKSGRNGGMFYHNRIRAVSLAVYKQPHARMQDIKKDVNKVLENLTSNGKNLDFKIGQDQTELLNYSLLNLQQTLLLGIFLAMLIMFVFTRQPGIPIVAGFSIPISLVISFFFLHIAHISLNIISLAGIILSVGLMVDNSIIVLDNINQLRLVGNTPSDATVYGTNEIIRPLISSVLTTCVVFIPLTALSGLAGAIFFDQAITVTVSLIVSLLVSILITPVLYLVLNKSKKASINNKMSERLLNSYENVMVFILHHKIKSTFFFLALIPIGFIMYLLIKKEKFPELKQKDMIVTVDWNKPVSLDENKKRVFDVTKFLMPFLKSSSYYIGEKGFIMNKGENPNRTSSFLYLNFDSTINEQTLGETIKTNINHKYPKADVKILPSNNIFRTVFNTTEPDLTAKFRNRLTHKVDIHFINKIDQQLTRQKDLTISEKFSNFQSGYEIVPKYTNLLLYDVSLNSVINKLKIMFGGIVIDKLPYGNRIMNVIISDRQRSLYEMLSSTSVINTKGIGIPLNDLVYVKGVNELRTIHSDKDGEYYMVSFNTNNKMNRQQIEQRVLSAVRQVKNVDVKWGGSSYEQSTLFKQLMVILFVSIILLYLILAAQFESLVLPMIILVEIFIDISGALLFLFLFGSSFNLMSVLGIIIMSGIVINDSIIKIDAIRQIHKKGNPLFHSILEGGRRRFFPIVMTSLTTILALISLFFFKGLGVELQLPLALSVIGALFVGTIVSLFFVPVLYYFLFRKQE